MKAPFGEKGTQAMIVIYSLVGFYFPCLITWASFAHITLLSKKTSPMARCYGERQRAQQRALLRMCAVTSITLTLCWLPSQTIYVLTPFGVTQIGSTLHRAGGIVAMFNSWINPLIYWMTNSEYRVDLTWKCFRKESSQQSKQGSDYAFPSGSHRSIEGNSALRHCIVTFFH